MSNTFQLINELSQLDIHLSLQDGKLRVDAPQGILSPALEQRIREQKNALIEVLRSFGQQLPIDVITRQTGNQPIALSAKQYQIYQHQLTHPESRAYNFCGALQIREKINIDYLHKAWQQLLLSHDLLRTRVVKQQSTAYLDINRSHQQSFFVEEHLDIATEELPFIAKNFTEEELHHAFDLTQGPLVRLRLIRYRQQQYLLILSAHGLICDQRSLALLLRKLFQLYIDTIQHKTPAISTAEDIQFSDYQHWQQQHTQQAAVQKHLIFWTEQFQQEPPRPLILPSTYSTEYYANKHAIKPASIYHFEIPAALTSKLEALAVANKVNLATLLLGAYQIVLAHHSGKQQFYLNIPHSGRQHPQTIDMVGPFAHSLLLKCNVTCTQSLTQFLHQIEASLAAVNQHARIELEQLDSLRPHEMSLNVQVSFQYTALKESLGSELSALGQTQIELVEFNPLHLLHDSQLSIKETTHGNLQCELAYNHRLFDHALITTIEDCFVNLLKHMVQQQYDCIAQLSVLSEKEKLQQIHFWNQTKTETPIQSLVHTFNQQARLYAEAIAVIDDDQHYTYQQLNERSEALAALIKQQAASSQHIGIFLTPGFSHIVATLGILKTNRAYVPVNPALDKQTLARTVHELNLKTVISCQPLLKQLPEHVQVIPIDTLKSDIPESINAILDDDAESPLYYLDINDAQQHKNLDRSLTTRALGISKASHSNLVHWYIRTTGLSNQDRLLICTPLHQSIAQRNIFATLCSGACMVLANTAKNTQASLIEDIQRQKISVLNCSPQTFYSLLKSRENWDTLHQLRWITLSGQRCYLNPLRPWLSRIHPEHSLMYAHEIPEASGICSYHMLYSDSPENLSPIGKPIDNTQLFVLNANGNIAATYAYGELYIGGDGLSLGYLNNPELNQQHFIENSFGRGQLFKTRQCCSRQSDGVLVHMTETTPVARIEPQTLYAQIESILYAQPGVAQAFVTTDEKQTDITAYVCTNHENQLSLEQLRTATHTRLLPQARPHHFQLLNDIHLDYSGQPGLTKLEHSEIPASIAGQMQTHMSTTEKMLAVIWAQLLSTAQIDVDSHFFALGGNSLLAMLATQQVEVHLQQCISTTLLFQYPRLSEYAAALDNQQAHSHPLPAITPPESDTQQALGPFQAALLTLATPKQHFHSTLLCFKHPLDASLVSQAVQALHRLHPVLNLSVDTDNQQQWIQSEYMPALDVIASNKHNNKAGSLKHIKKLYAEYLASIDTQAFFKAQYRLFNTGQQPSQLSIVVSALICDQPGFYSILNDLLNLLTNPAIGTIPHRQEGQEVEAFLHSMRLHQQQLNNDELYQRQLHYWRQQLDGAPRHLNLPVQSTLTLNHAEDRQDDIQRYYFSIAPALSQAFTTFCHTHNITLFMGLLANYHLLLCRHSRQDDICVALPMVRNVQPTLNGYAGHYHNTVVIRLKPGQNPRVDAYLKQVRRATLDAMQHADIPLHKLFEALNIATDEQPLPYCRAAFHFSSNPKHLDALHAFDLDPDNVRLMHSSSLSGSFLQLQIHIDDTGQLNACFEYAANLLDREKIALFAQHYCYLLEEMIQDDKQPVQTLEMLTDNEVYKLLALQKSKYERVGRLTNMQRDIYIDSTLDKTQSWNYFGQIIGFNSEIDPQLFERAIQTLIDIEPNLRTHIKASRTVYADIAFRCILRQGDPESRQSLHITEHNGDLQSLEKTAHAFIYQPYNLEKETGLRNQLIRFNQKQWFWVCAFHHVVIDGLGMHLYILKILEIYEKLSQKSKVEYQRYDFDDYYTYQSKLSDTQETLEYWHNVVKHVEPLSGGKHLAKPDESAQDIKRIVELDLEHSANIRKYCFRHRTTPASYTKAILTILLKAYFNQRDRGLIFNEVRIGRTRENGWTLGCCFTNQPFAVPTNILDKNSSFSHLLNFTTNYQQQVGPYEFISNSQQVRVINETDIQFSFNFYGAVPPVQLFGIDCDIIEVVPFLENAIHVVGRMVDKRLRVLMLYNNKIWSDHRFLERFAHISQQIMQGADQLDSLQLLLPDEQETTPAVRVAPYTHRSLADWLNSCAEKYADNIAIIDDQHSFSYAMLHRHANQLAHYIHQQTSNKKPSGHVVRIAICLPVGAELVTALLATIKCGGVYIPIDPNYPQERIHYILNDANIDQLITQKEADANIHIAPEQCLFLDNSESGFYRQAEQYPDTPPAIHTDLDDLLYIIYTSGSAGKPKGVQIKIRGEINLLQWYCKEFAFNEQDRHLIISAVGFDLTQKNFFAPLLSGGCIITPGNSHYDPVNIRHLINEHQATLINCAPSAFYPLVEEAQYYYSVRSLRLVLFGGEPIRIKALLNWLDNEHCQAQLVNMYGPTECTDIATFYRIENPAEFIDKPIPIGKANDNVRLYVIDPDRRQLPAGIAGELAIGGQSVGAGYLNNNERTRQSFIDNPFAPGRLYLTGDLVKLDHTGNLIFLSRIDFQLKLRGLRIEPGEIEYALRELDQVKDALVLVRNEQLIAYVIQEEGQSIAEDWRKQLSKILPPHMLPHALVSLQKWPLTPNGKIDRRALPEPEQQQNYVAPRNRIEEQLANIWQDILNIEKIGIYDNFFELGGHSLIAIRLARRIQDELRVELPISALFNAQDIASLASILSGDVSAQGCLLPLKAGSDSPPIFMIHPVSGLAIGFQALCRHLKTEQPVIGIQAYGFDDQHKASFSVEEAAERYLEAIRHTQKKGPYYLAGYSLGGAIALEVARRIIESGEQVAWFTIIDAESNFRWFSRQLDTTYLLYHFYQALHPDSDITLSALKKIPENEQVEWLFEHSPEHISLNLLQHSAEVLSGFKQMMDSYQAQPLDINAIYISSEQRQQSPLMKLAKWTGLRRNTLGWEKIIRGKLRHFSTPGDHDSLMQEPDVHQLAALIDYSLRKHDILFDSDIHQK